jgi:hypothetical protein
MSSVEDAWPLPKYDNGPPKHVHAIRRDRACLRHAAKRNGPVVPEQARSEWAEKYYYLLNEEKRSDAIKEVFKNADPGVVEAIGNIVKYSIDAGPAGTSFCTQRVIHPALFLFPMALLA